MPLNAVDWALANPALVLTGVIALIATAWAYEAYDEAEDGREALSGFGQRVKRGTGGVLNVVLVSLVAAVGAAAQAAGTLGELGQYVLGLVPHGPVIAAGVLNIGIAGVALSDFTTLHPIQYVGIAGVILVIAVAWKVDLS